FGPSKPTISPRCTSKDTSFTATVPSNSLRRPFTSTTCSTMGLTTAFHYRCQAGIIVPDGGKMPPILNWKERNVMKVKAATAVLGLAIMVSATAPVFAEDAPSTVPEEKTKTKSDGGGLSGLPGKALGATFGALFGTPIAIVRK